MSLLKIFPAQGAEQPEIVNDHPSIAARLNQHGIRFEQWSASQELSDTASQEEVIEAYRASVDRLMEESGFQTCDVVGLKPDHPQKVEFRNKFLNEHTHSEDEVRFFVDGTGLFYMHIDEEVLGVLCEKGDLISVPANTRHWFDMGPEPDFKCIRLFTNPEGWVAQFTGDAIADRFPRHGE